MMRRVADGDRAAFSEIIHGHQERVWAVAIVHAAAAMMPTTSVRRLHPPVECAPRWEPAARLVLGYIASDESLPGFHRKTGARATSLPVISPNLLRP